MIHGHPNSVRRFARGFAFVASALLILAPGPSAAGDRSADAAGAKSGLWFGPVHLCRDTVAEAVAGIEDYSGQPTLTLTLASGLQPRLQRATARKVHRTIKIRLDGRVMQEPRVHEPITGTSLRLSGFSREEAEQIRAAALRPC